MSDLAEELRTLAATLRDTSDRADRRVRDIAERLERSATTIASAWSGSSLGYHSRVYYAGLETPPPGAHFSREWGLMGTFQGSTGDWREYSYVEVFDHIVERAGGPDLEQAQGLVVELSTAVSQAQTTIDSILETWLADHPADTFVAKIRETAAGTRILDAARATELQIQSGQIMTRDSTALSQGLQGAPHQAVLGIAAALRSPFFACDELTGLAEQAAAHLERVDRRQRREVESTAAGSFVFIGHGRSPMWRELKDFVQERIGLTCDEFNRVPVAGVTNIERLVQMLNDAAIALLVLTAEDETAEGSVLARQNVVHEAGLFQGRLGFTRAIVLLEEGCEEFSNIAGLGQIRFPSGNIAACFEEVRRVLEREGLA